MSGQMFAPQTQENSSSPIKKRKRATNACLRCRLKKQRCDGISQPCANCAKASSECKFPDDAMGEKFLRQHIANLEARVRTLSSALAEIDPHHSALKDKETESLSEKDLVDGFGFLCLTSGAEPLYVGGSSGASWGRIFSSALCNQAGEAHFSAGNLIPRKESRSASPSESFGRKFSASRDSPDFSDMESPSFHSRIPIQLKTGFIFPPLPKDHALSDEIFAIVHTTIQPRHCFMNFVALKEWYNDREEYCTPRKPLVAEGPRTAAFFLWLTHALGLRLWEMRGRIIPGLPSHEHYFQAALQYFDHVSANTTTIQALLFLAMYSFRAANGLSAWHLAGLAMRTALELGLHRKTPKAQELDPFNEEMRKRIWWSVYSLERTIAVQLGRPISIQEDEIDNELPLDIDCHITDPEQIIARRMAINVKLLETGTTLENNPYPLGWTTMSPALHHIRLRKILSKVKQTVYHPTFSSESMETRCSHVDSLSLELDHWRDHIPAKNTPTKNSDHTVSRHENPEADTKQDKRKGLDSIEIPYYSSEWFELQYHNAVQILLIRYALTAGSANTYLHRAARSAMTACELQRKRLLKNSSAPLSVYSLHKLFMAGVFMLFALDKDPDLSLNKEIELIDRGRPSPDSENLSDNNSTLLQGLPQQFPHPIKCCHESLSIYAVYYPQAKPYAQCFESMAKRWMQRLDSRHLQQTILGASYSTSFKKSEKLATFESTTAGQSFKECNPPTLWKNELNPSVKLSQNIEGTGSFNFDMNFSLQSEPPQYDVFSLGLVGTNCESLKLLQSETERYQSRRPWFSGNTKEQRSNPCSQGSSETLGTNLSSSVPSYYSGGSRNFSSPENLTPDLASYFVENQSLQVFLDSQATLSEYSSLNEASSDQNLNPSPVGYSPTSTDQIQSPKIVGSCTENSQVLLRFDRNEFSQLPTSGRQNPQPFDAQNFLGDEASSNYDRNIIYLENLSQHNSVNVPEFSGSLPSVSTGISARLTSGVYNLPELKIGPSLAWLEEGIELYGENINLSTVCGQVTRSSIGDVVVGKAERNDLRLGSQI